MELLHAFPRPTNKLAGTSPAQVHSTALKILESIFSYGLLCTPEKLRIYADPATANEAKKALLRGGEPDFVYTQSRFCMTMSTPEELYNNPVVGLMPGKTGPEPKGQHVTSHAGLFGPFAISIDPKVARRIGIVPTMYFSPNDIQGEAFTPYKSNAYMIQPGFGWQTLIRLKEIRNLLTLLAIIEREEIPTEGVMPDEEILRQSNFLIPHEEEIVERAFSIPKKLRAQIAEALWNDRESSAVLKSSVEMLLSLFQQTDGRGEEQILAWYQQREWRLIYHNRYGLDWYSIGDQPEFRARLNKKRKKQRVEIGQLVSRNGAEILSPDYLERCWVLERVDGDPIQKFIQKVIAPSDCLDEVAIRMGPWCNSIDIVPAEDFGFTAD